MKVKLNSLLGELRGKLESTDDTNTVFRMKNGKQQIYLQKKQTSERTNAQTDHTNKFVLAHQQAKTIYNNPTLRQQKQQEYDQNHGEIDGIHYKTLYNYIFKSIYLQKK